MRPNTTTELEDTNGEPALKIFPNPASSSVSVALENMPDANYNLSLYDVVGKKVQETVKIAGNRADLDVSGLQNGIYFLNVEKDNSVIKKERIVVNH
jgi:putative ubiquitin-RnfH superfamily antitoxin RatB of RatAB toxin-antitoxin module